MPDTENSGTAQKWTDPNVCPVCGMRAPKLQIESHLNDEHGWVRVTLHEDEDGQGGEDEDDGTEQTTLLTDGGTDREPLNAISPVATAAWVEVRDDGTPILCLDTDRGTTETYELSPEAAGELRREFLDGPTVRHDLDGGESA